MYYNKIDYHLKSIENDNKYCPQAVNVRLEDTETIAQRLSTTTMRYKKNELIYIMAEIKELIERILLEGRAVRLDGLCTISPQISGSFDSYHESFNRKKHKINLTITVDDRLDERVNSNLGVRKVHIAD